jgi:hypothetical protein
MVYSVKSKGMGFTHGIYTITFFIISVLLFVSVSILAEDEGPVAYWFFDEGKGQIAKDIVGGNHGSLGATEDIDDNDPAWVEGISGKALLFTGENATCVEVPADPVIKPKDAITVMAWINTTTRSGNHQIVSAKWDNDVVGYRLNQSWSALAFEIGDGKSYHQIRGGTLTTNTWHHVAATFDGRVIKIYIDGEIVESEELDEVVHIVHDPRRSLVIGNYVGRRDAYPFDGMIDEVGIFNRALSEEEIDYYMKWQPYIDNKAASIEPELDNIEGRVEVNIGDKIIPNVAGERPFMRFDRIDETTALATFRKYRLATDDVLRQLVNDDKKYRHPAITALQHLVSIIDKESGVRILIERILCLGLEDADKLTETDLIAQIDKTGAQNSDNNRLKIQAYYYSLRYYIKKDEEDARRTIAILNRFAEVMPEWPLIDRDGKPHSQNEKSYLQHGDANGLWGEWYYMDPWASQPLLWAWDLIGASQAMKEPGVSQHIEEKLLRFMVEHQFKYSPPTYGNLENYILDGLVDFGLLLPEPEYIHRIVRWHNAVVITQFYADGFWHEGTPAYHKDIWQGLAVSVSRLLEGYSDPPGFTNKETLELVEKRNELKGAPGFIVEDGGVRFEDLDLGLVYESQFRRMEEAIKKLTLPNGSVACLHDGFEYTYRAWWTTPPVVGRPMLLGSSGHGILGTGQGNKQMYVHLHFGGMHGHEHYDALNVLLWAQGYELLSEGMYRPLPGDEISTRAWHTATAGHNTVVIDGRNQAGRGANKTRKLGPNDAVPGILDSRYREGGHGNTLSDGELLIFESTLDEVQIIEAGAEQSYVPRPELYRRTIAMVTAEEGEGYVFDVFRVRGGKYHDWMLHGCLQEPYEVRFDLPLESKSEKVHGYIKDLKIFKTDESFVFDMEIKGGPLTRVYMMGQPKTEVICGQGPAMRRIGTAPFIDIHHQGSESIFVAVHEPRESTKPLIESVEFINIEASDGKGRFSLLNFFFPQRGTFAVGARIKFTDGRIDLIISTMDEADGPLREIKEWGVALRGRFAHARLAEDGSVQWLYLVRGEYFRVGDEEVNGAIPFTGEIISTTRIEAREERDTLITETLLPEGDALKGRALIMDLGGTLVQSLIIDHVEITDGKSIIVTKDDPGISIEKGLVRLEHYPNWGRSGKCRFLIENPQLKAEKGVE